MDVNRTILQGAGLGPMCLKINSDRRINPNLRRGTGLRRCHDGSGLGDSDGPCPSDGPDVGGGDTWDNGRERRFTNTAVPRFDGTGCWQQHIVIFWPIMTSNGWSPMTAVLQLFAHLDGRH